MNKPCLDSCSKASRRRFLTGTAMATALAVARPVTGVHGGLPGATRGTIPEDGSGALPRTFSALKPLGSRVHPITADEFHGRLVHAQKLMTEAGPNYDALFVALCQDLGLQGVTADEPLNNVIHTDFPQISLLRNW